MVTRSENLRSKIEKARKSSQSGTIGGRETSRPSSSGGSSQPTQQISQPSITSNLRQDAQRVVGNVVRVERRNGNVTFVGQSGKRFTPSRLGLVRTGAISSSEFMGRTGLSSVPTVTKAGAVVSKIEPRTQAQKTRKTEIEPRTQAQKTRKTERQNRIRNLTARIKQQQTRKKKEPEFLRLKDTKKQIPATFKKRLDRVETLRLAQEKRFGKGVENINQFANFVTGGRGLPAEKRSALGRVAQSALTGILGWPLFLIKDVPIASAETMAVAESFIRKETRNSAVRRTIPTLIRTAKETFTSPEFYGGLIGGIAIAGISGGLSRPSVKTLSKIENSLKAKLSTSKNPLAKSNFKRAINSVKKMKKNAQLMKKIDSKIRNAKRGKTKISKKEIRNAKRGKTKISKKEKQSQRQLRKEVRKNAKARKRLLKGKTTVPKSKRVIKISLKKGSKISKTIRFVKRKLRSINKKAKRLDKRIEGAINGATNKIVKNFKKLDKIQQKQALQIINAFEKINKPTIRNVKLLISKVNKIFKKTIKTVKKKLPKTIKTVKKKLPVRLKIKKVFKTRKTKIGSRLKEARKGAKARKRLLEGKTTVPKSKRVLRIELKKSSKISKTIRFVKRKLQSINDKAKRLDKRIERAINGATSKMGKNFKKLDKIQQKQALQIINAFEKINKPTIRNVKLLISKVNKIFRKVGKTIKKKSPFKIKISREQPKRTLERIRIKKSSKTRPRKSQRGLGRSKLRKIKRKVIIKKEGIIKQKQSNNNLIRNSKKLLEDGRKLAKQKASQQKQKSLENKYKEIKIVKKDIKEAKRNTKRNPFGSKEKLAELDRLNRADNIASNAQKSVQQTGQQTIQLLEKTISKISRAVNKAKQIRKNTASKIKSKLNAIKNSLSKQRTFAGKIGLSKMVTRLASQMIVANNLIAKVNAKSGAGQRQKTGIITKPKDKTGQKRKTVQEQKKDEIKDEIIDTKIIPAQRIDTLSKVKQLQIIGAVLASLAVAQAFRVNGRRVAKKQTRLRGGIASARKWIFNRLQKKRRAFTPDIYSLLFGIRAKKGQRIQLLRKGRVFTGLERRAITR